MTFPTIRKIRLKMQSKLVLLIFLFFFAQSVWKAVLKPGVYPPSIKWYLKWLHALILYYLLIYAFLSFDALLWLIHFRSELIASFSSDSKLIPGPVAGTLNLIFCASGLALPFIVERMAKRQKKALRWFFGVWSVNAFSQNYLIVKWFHGKEPIWAIAFVISVLSFIFLVTMVFYLSSSVRKILFAGSENPS